MPARGATGTAPPHECPVCLESFVVRRARQRGVRTGDFFFQCATHPLCHECDDQMRATHDLRCPVCRAPRLGISAADAEPPPDRNAPPVETLLGLGGGGHLGLAAGRRMLGPPMFFPLQEMIDLAPTPQLRPDPVPGASAAERQAAEAAIARLAERARAQARALGMGDPPVTHDVRAHGAAADHPLLAELCRGIPAPIARWRALHSAARSDSRAIPRADRRT